MLGIVFGRGGVFWVGFFFRFFFFFVRGLLF